MIRVLSGLGIRARIQVLKASEQGEIDWENWMGLSKRAISVLCAAVELYIRNGEPVASRHVARHSGLGLSSPTVRNVMAELVEAGFLSRPHASAGSLPSDRGFRLFVDSMPRRSAPPPAVRRDLAGRMVSMRRELVEDIEWVAQLIAETTREAGVAVRPMGDGPVLEAVSLVLLESRRVLGVVITDDGTVEKRVLDLDRDRTREQLQAISNYLTRTLSGISIQDIEVRVSDMGNSTDLDEMQIEAREVAQQLFARDQNDVEVQVAGTEYLLATPDFSEIERVRSLLSALQDRACIASEFRRVFERGKTQVLIGEESQATASGGLGIVATLYFRDARRAGAVGVVGSRRMDYQRIVPVVEYVGETLTQMLETTGASHA